MFDGCHNFYTEGVSFILLEPR